MFGSDGEKILQERYGTKKRATLFYENQMLGYLNHQMKEFIAQQEMMFIATADRNGNCDNSFRSGRAGFVRVIDDTTVIYPEYRGNGVLASLGNIYENPHIGILFIDFFKHGIGLHINGKAKVIEHNRLEMLLPLTMAEGIQNSEEGKVEHWVVIKVEEAYVHCSKRIPMLQKIGMEEQKVKQATGDFFKVKKLKEDKKAADSEEKWKVYAT